jgi:hypothetical protein
MIAALILATLAAAPGRPPQAGVEPAHAPAEAALLRTAYPDYDAASGRLGHGEGVLVGRSSACQETGLCFLAVAASDGRDGAESGGHAWSTSSPSGRSRGAGSRRGPPPARSSAPWGAGSSASRC